MEIIIGRDESTSKLSIITEHGTILAGAPNSVPQSVSRKHCAITINNDGTMRIKNINPRNFTYVNGMPIMTKVLSRNDTVELSTDRYKLSWKLIDESKPKEADIKPLQRIWETYNSDNKAVAQKAQRFQVVRGILPVLTMAAVLIGYISGGRGAIFYFLYGLVILLTIFFSRKAWQDIGNNDEQREKIKDQFTHDYCCPKCGYFFGFTDYNILAKNLDFCPKCKTKLKK